MYRAAAEIQRRLRESDISSVLIGGLAVALWGEPRLTRDIDLKVALGRDDTDRLLRALRSEWEPLAANPAHALEQFGGAIELDRVVVIEPGFEVVPCTPEDLISYKLVSTRPLDHEDARRVAVRQGDALDDGYVVDWLAQFEQAVDDSTLIATYRDLRAQPHA